MGPFDRFNDRAKRVLALAQDEAIRLNHNYIGGEHLLLGLVREGGGVAAQALRSLGVELSKARTAVEFIIGRGDSATSPSDITLSPRTKKIIELAIDEARKLGHAHVGTEHLLLGIAREGGSIATGVLQSLGIASDRVRHQVIATIGQQPPREEPAAPHIIPAYRAVAPVDRLDETSRRVVARSYYEAGRAESTHLDAIHLLRALVSFEAPWLVRLFADLGVNPSDLAARIDEQLRPRADTARPAHIAETPMFSSALARAGAFAAERGSALIRVEHLLFGIASDTGGHAAQILRDAGITPERVRAAVDRMSE